MRIGPEGALRQTGKIIVAEEWLEKRIQDQPTLGTRGLSLLVKLKTVCDIQSRRTGTEELV